MGLSFITEGSIPFGASDPARAIPSFMIGAAVAGGLTGMANIKIDGTTWWSLRSRFDKQSFTLSLVHLDWRNCFRPIIWCIEKSK